MLFRRNVMKTIQLGGKSLIIPGGTPTLSAVCHYSGLTLLLTPPALVLGYPVQEHTHLR